jgi:5-methylcytosine-specific restriction endonuclease McrA
MRGHRATPEGREASRQADIKYRQSKQGTAKRKEYGKSDSRKDSLKRYSQTPKGKAVIYRSNHTPEALVRRSRYYYSGKGKITNDRYQQTEKGKACLARGVHKRRGKMLIESKLTAAEWTEIKNAHNQKCFYCQATGIPLTMDHLIPLSKGGHHVKGNIVPACRSCNAKKGNRPLVNQMLPLD